MKIAGRINVETVSDLVSDACKGHTFLISSGQVGRKEKAIEQEEAQEGASPARQKTAATGSNGAGYE